MSWGYFADLRIELPTDAWTRILARKPAEITLAPGWSGFVEAPLEQAFGKPITRDETFAKVIAWKCYTGAEAIERITTDGKRTKVRITVMLDKSQLELAFPLAALLWAAREAEGAGSLRLVNDGTYSGENGTELTLKKGRIGAKKLDEIWPIVDELGAELFGDEIDEDDEPASAPKKPAAKKPAAKKPAAKKPAAKKPAAKTPAAKKPAAKTPAAKKPAAKKPAAKKPAAKRAAK